MKTIVFLLCCLLSAGIFAQDTTAAFDGHKWQAPYTLAFPQGWGVERFPIPIEFAPQIKYKGVEDIRFTPGWGKAGTDDYWSYAFLWYLDGKQSISAKTMEDNLKAYYAGLVGRNIVSRKIADEKLVTIKTAFTPVQRDKGDLSTFHGTVFMLDYMEQKPITLNCIVHVRTCPGQNKTFVFNEISPQPYGHAVWKSLNDLWLGFSCSEGEKAK